jgi:hypothetical protein
MTLLLIGEVFLSADLRKGSLSFFINETFSQASFYWPPGPGLPVSAVGERIDPKCD